MKRRKVANIITLVLLAPVAIGALSSCISFGGKAPEPAPISTEASATPAPKTAAPNKPQSELEQHLKIGLSIFPAALDPHLTTSQDKGAFGLFFDALTRQKEDGTAVPWLAESWKLVDSKTWRFSLRQGVKFHNGEKLNSAAAKSSLDRVMKTENAIPAGQLVTGIKEAKVVDEYTLDIVTTDPDPLIPRKLSWIWILPPNYFKVAGAEVLGMKPIGTGTYRCLEFIPDSQWQAELWEEHLWRKPKLRQIEATLLTDAKSRVAALRNGEVDLIDSVPKEQVKGLSDGKFQVVEILTGQTTAFSLDMSTLSDTRVRQAINYAVDKQAILKEVFGGYGKAADGQLTQAGNFGHSLDLKPYPYDKDKARELLATAGFGKGFETVIEAPADDAMAKEVVKLIQKYLAEVNIRAKFTSLSPAEYRNKFYRGSRAPMFYETWSTLPLMDADAVYQWYSCSKAAGVRRWCNEDFEKAYKASRVELDAEKRQKLLQQAGKVMYQEAPVLFVIQPATHFGLSKEVQGFTPRSDGLVWFDPIYLSK